MKRKCIKDFKIVAHRGLLNGPSKDLENNPEIILEIIKNHPRLLIEIDLNIMEDGIYLGHDYPNYKIDIDFIIKNKDRFILHVKRFDSESDFVNKSLSKIYKISHCFSHEDDNFTITNRGWIWSHPKMGFVPNSIFVLPEKFVSLNSREFRNKINLLKGICTDFPLEIKHILYG